MALSRAGDVFIANGQTPGQRRRVGLRSTTPRRFAKTDTHRQNELFALLLQVEEGTGLPPA
ncbi:MAG: hypothetical protein DLM68_16900 [Hyphomicrobiales bacterium]|nr:MAG: hypothetical protein DLM68_16900 [Hyphomicrobiales bacterium]